jgi:dihydrolipoamide dehydrogenase
MEERSNVEEVPMPALADGMSGTIGRWHKQEGETVRKGEALAEIETESGAITVEAPASGILRQRHYETGATAPTSGALAVIEPVDEAQPAPVPAPKPPLTPKERRMLILRIGFRTVELIVLIVGLFFLAIRMYQIGFIIFVIGSLPYLATYCYRAYRAVAARLKRHPARPGD